MLFLDMTYIPNLEEDHFFVWITENGRLHSRCNTRKYLDTSRWRQHYFRTKLREEKVFFEDETGTHIEVSGCFVPMGEMFRFFMSGERLDGHRLSLGETSECWIRLAENLSELLQAGRYYPTLLTVEKDNMCHVFSQWMLSRQPFTSSEPFNEWIRSFPLTVFSALDLAPFSTRQWLDLLLDTWTDRVVRMLISPSFPWRPFGRVPDLADRWLNDLKQPQNICYYSTEVTEEKEQLKRLKRQLERWHQCMNGDARTHPKQTLEDLKCTNVVLHYDPVTLCLWLEPENEETPFSPGEHWLLRLNVYVKDGKNSQILNGKEAWCHHLSVKQWMQKKFHELARVDDVFARFHHQLYDHDFSFHCSSEEVMRLYKGVDVDDIHIRFPEWVDMKIRKEDHLDIRLKPNVINGQQPFTLNAIVRFDWQVSVGEISLSRARFERLVKQQQRFLRREDEWVELPLEKMKAAYREMIEKEKTIGRHGNMTDLLRLSAESKERRHHHVQMAMHPEIHHYLDRLLNTSRKRTKPLPEGFRGILRPYQKRGYAWLDELRQNRVGGCLADDMGLGKTIQAIAYLLAGKTDCRKEPALIVCPTSLLENWRTEFGRFAPGLSVYIHHGPHRLDAKAFQMQKNTMDVMITNYSVMTRDATWLLEEHWSSVIIDEAQAIKNPATQQSKVIRSLKGAHRIALTGTPLENRLEELWSIMDFLNPGYLGSLQQFRKAFIHPIERTHDQGKVQLLRTLVHPFVLRREKDDRTIIRDLPGKIERKAFCHLSEEQASLYQSIVDELMTKMTSASGMARKGLILSSLTRLKQLCDHPQLVLNNKPTVDHSGKLVHLLRLLESLLTNRRRTLIFTQYVKMGRMLTSFIREKFPGCPVFFMHGGLSSDRRNRLIRQFRAQESNAIFIMSLKTGGVGLNLTEASNVIHYDRWWNPAVENQATDRVHRIGQNENVLVYKLISVGTLEERIDEMIEKKEALTRKIIGEGNHWVTEMHDEEIYDLIRLRKKEAVK